MAADRWFGIHSNASKVPIKEPRKAGGLGRARARRLLGASAQFAVHGEAISVIQTPRPKVPAMSLPRNSSISSEMTTTFGNPSAKGTQLSRRSSR
jgi:hypothetical protein